MFLIHTSVFIVLIFYLTVVKAPNSQLASKVLEKAVLRPYGFVNLLSTWPPSTTWHFSLWISQALYLDILGINKWFSFVKLKPLTLVNCIGVSLGSKIINTFTFQDMLKDSLLQPTHTDHVIPTRRWARYFYRLRNWFLPKLTTGFLQQWVRNYPKGG